MNEETDQELSVEQVTENIVEQTKEETTVVPETTKKDFIDRIPMNVLRANESGSVEEDGFKVSIANKLMKVSFSQSVVLPAKFTIKKTTSERVETVVAERTATNKLGLSIPVSALKGEYVAELQDKNGKISSVKFTV